MCKMSGEDHQGVSNGNWHSSTANSASLRSGDVKSLECERLVKTLELQDLGTDAIVAGI